MNDSLTYVNEFFQVKQGMREIRPLRSHTLAFFERAQLLVRAAQRADMQPFLRAWREALLERDERRVRWSLDVDPQEV